MSHAVITENDVSQWEDRTGEVYHFPARYRRFLQPGTKVIYYKGRLTDRAFRSSRLSDEPHYFACATIGKVFADQNSTKGDVFAAVENFQRFSSPVFAKTQAGYREVIPESRRLNYWRDGVRSISPEVYRALFMAGAETGLVERVRHFSQTNDIEQAFESGFEGTRKRVFSTRYERDPKLRKLAVAIHGTCCAACKFDFAAQYGTHGDGYIHVHHLRPLSEGDGGMEVNPATDLAVLCANCHSMVHRMKNRTLDLDELKAMIRHPFAG